MDAVELGDIGPGESKSFKVPLRGIAKDGDIAILVISWICGECNEIHMEKIKVVIGEVTPTYSFGCDCTSLWSKLKRIFAG